MSTKISKSLLESISNVVNSDSKNLTEASEFAYDIMPGTDPDEFLTDFDEVEGTKVGNWMKSLEAMKKLMKAANTNSYEFKEVILPKGKADTKETVTADHKAKGFKLFDYGTTSKGETGLLFYKK